jgi:hypothetical protein
LPQFPQGAVLPEVGQLERAPVADADSQLHVSARVTAVTGMRINPRVSGSCHAFDPDDKGKT